MAFQSALDHHAMSQVTNVCAFQSMQANERMSMEKSASKYTHIHKSKKDHEEDTWQKKKYGKICSVHHMYNILNIHNNSCVFFVAVHSFVSFCTFKTKLQIVCCHQACNIIMII